MCSTTIITCENGRASFVGGMAVGGMTAADARRTQR